MLAAVRRLLADERLDVGAQLRRPHAVPELADALDEEALTLREEERERVEEVRDVEPVGVPGADVVAVDLEADVTANDAHGLRRATRRNSHSATLISVTSFSVAQVHVSSRGVAKIFPAGHARGDGATPTP